MTKIDFIRQIGKVIGEGSVIFAVLLFIFKRKYSSKLEKELENHKESLQRESETIRHEMSKKIYNYQNANQRIHEIYPKIYQLLIKADSAIANIDKAGLSRGSTYDAWNRKDVKIALETKKATLKIIEEVNSAFNDSPKKGIETFKKWEEFLDGVNAKNSIRDAKNEYWLKKIYISESISKKIDALLTALSNRLITIEYPDHITNHKKHDKEKDDITNALYDLEEKMRKELIGI